MCDFFWFVLQLDCWSIYWWRSGKLHNVLLLVHCVLSFGSRAFRISAPNIWNSLPPHILQSQTLFIWTSFKDPLLSVSVPCPLAPIPKVPWFSSETLALYKSFTYLLTNVFCWFVNLWDVVSWQLGLVEREISELLQGSVTRQAQQRTAPSQPTSSADSENRTAGPAGVTVPQREIGDDDICPICQEELLAHHQPVTFCRSVCLHLITVIEN